ncbi:hypothetical protein K458DRAFT_419367 [Lentithecium fluviatile CBS 122367]|uniref:Uncharacterized protein n=1 Tax=Lentithecium fluviatile CBS 122367 TaxID=1168545 RepID=A0A6G1IYW9_9PLEO|nr:hypothetical protein K458DRAFT_419367 [Lentithecium fluviatile CBS 122367]
MTVDSIFFCECDLCCPPPLSLICLDDDFPYLHHAEDPAYRDLRSASRAKQRQRKHVKRYDGFRTVTPIDCPSHPEQRAHYLPTCRESRCPTHNTLDACPLRALPADLSIAPTRKFTKREAWKEARRFCRRTRRNPHKVKRAVPTWKWARRRREQAEMTDAAKKGWEEDVDLNWFLHYLDEDHYYFLEWERDCWEGQTWIYKDGVETEAMLSWVEWTVSGETFSAWCQRRINEMRAVKEARLRAELAPEDPSQSTSILAIPDPNEDEGYHSSTSTSSTKPHTTLPTDPFDIHGHKLLHDVLQIPAQVRKHQPWVRHCVVPDDYHWFGEYVWYWHRNETGCWIVLDWPCGENNSLCFCEKWEGEEWMGWDPEKGRKCWLAELVKGDGWDGLWDEDDGRVVLEGGEGSVDEEVEVEQEEDEWDFISIMSASSTWTEVDAPSDVEIL